MKLNNDVEISEIDETTLKIVGKANVTRRLFEQAEKDVFSIHFKGGKSLEVGQNIDGFIVEHIEHFDNQEESFFIIKGKKA